MHDKREIKSYNYTVIYSKRIHSIIQIHIFNFFYDQGSPGFRNPEL